MDKHNVRRGKTFMFADDQERTVFPLTISQLRKFVKVVEKMGETQSAVAMSDEDIALMVEASQIILGKVDPKLANDTEALEDAIDLVVFNEIMNVAMGNASPEE